MQMSITFVSTSISWDKYQVADMDIISFEDDRSNYEHVIILLHGGGASYKEWRERYTAGWFGDITGYKLVFPTTADDGRVWYWPIDNYCDMD